MTIEGIIEAAIGGLLIGSAAAAMLLLNGRIAGISGILGGAIAGRRESWRFSFLVGLLLGGATLMWVSPGAFAVPAGRSLPLVAVAGLLVGFGTSLGNGCTSGHGVCGVGRFSARSLVATLAFMGAGAVAASLIHLMGIGQ